MPVIYKVLFLLFWLPRVYFYMYFSERNLNPKAACLKRREEEKGEGSLGLDGMGGKLLTFISKNQPGSCLC